MEVRGVVVVVVVWHDYETNTLIDSDSELTYTSNVIQKLRQTR